MEISGQTVTGPAWTSSDPTIVSLSADDPPLLTALAAGPATADITVMDTLPMGTVIWSNAGTGRDTSRHAIRVMNAIGLSTDCKCAPNPNDPKNNCQGGTATWTEIR